LLRSCNFGRACHELALPATPKLSESRIEVEWVRAEFDAARRGLRTLPCCRALDFVQRRRVFQCNCVAEIRGAHNAAHHFRVSRFWYVADGQNFLGSERFAKLDGERVF